MLEICVTNTLANAISPEEIRQQWEKQSDLNSPYEDRQRNFEHESLESGLFGPVRLLEEKYENGE